MKKEEIKNIMIIFSDNYLVRVWDWIGNITLYTLKNKNICNEELLEDSEHIEKFIKSLLPTAIEFTQYRVEKNKSLYSRYRDITKEEVDRLASIFNDVYFIYNFDENFNNEGGGCESLIIDLENNKSYIR